MNRSLLILAIVIATCTIQTDALLGLLSLLSSSGKGSAGVKAETGSSQPTPARIKQESFSKECNDTRRINATFYQDTKTTVYNCLDTVLRDKKQELIDQGYTVLVDRLPGDFQVTEDVNGKAKSAMMCAKEEFGLDVVSNIKIATYRNGTNKITDQAVIDCVEVVRQAAANIKKENDPTIAVGRCILNTEYVTKGVDCFLKKIYPE